MKRWRTEAQGRSRGGGFGGTLGGEDALRGQEEGPARCASTGTHTHAQVRALGWWDGQGRARTCAVLRPPDSPQGPRGTGASLCASARRKNIKDGKHQEESSSSSEAKKKNKQKTIFVRFGVGDVAQDSFFFFFLTKGVGGCPHCFSVPPSRCGVQGRVGRAGEGGGGSAERRRALHDTGRKIREMKVGCTTGGRGFQLWWEKKRKEEKKQGDESEDKRRKKKHKKRRVRRGSVGVAAGP